MAAKPTTAPAECAQCGEDIPPRAKACPHCGADERTGWREASVYDGMELPDEAWDDEDGGGSSGSGPARGRRADHKPDEGKGGLPWYWTAVALMMIGLMVLFALWAWPGLF